MRIAAILVLLAGAAVADPYLSVARGIGDYLVGTAREDGEGRYWAQYEGPGREAMGEEHLFPVSLYSGSSGTGYFLLNLFRATRAKSYRKAAHGAGVRLIRIAQVAPGGGLRWEGRYERKGRAVPDGSRLGLYNGNAGIGWVLARMHQSIAYSGFRETAVGAFERLLNETDASRDIISGAAGSGLALLDMSRITEDPKYRSLAEKRAHWLLEQAEAHDDGLRWKGYKPFDAGFSHGAAGFAFFLEAAGQREGAKKAANWVESVAVPSGKESLLWRYYPGPPPEGKRNWTFNSWCHGAPGIVRLYLLMHARTGERRYLELALRAGGGVRESLGLDQGAPRYANPTYCCGAAGCLDAFLDLYGASGEKRWLNDARALADSIVKSLRGIEGSHVYATYDDSDQTTRKHPYVPTGFMHGNAGIGHALLRLALVIRGEEDRLVFLPDHPFAWKGK